MIWYRLSDLLTPTEKWERILEKKRWMEYALRHPTIQSHTHILSPLFSPYGAIPQSYGWNTDSSPLRHPPPLHLYLSPSLPPPTVRHALSLHLCWGVSEWWSFSGPCERSCGFSVPHITGRTLALCMLQEFGLAEHQALTTSSQHRPDKLPEPHSQYTWKYANVPLFIFILINLYKDAHVLSKH